MFRHTIPMQATFFEPRDLERIRQALEKEHGDGTDNADTVHGAGGRPPMQEGGLMVRFEFVRECANCGGAITPDYGKTPLAADAEWVHFDPRNNTTAECPRAGPIPKAQPKAVA